MILSDTPPRHTFLTRTQVMARYRWKRTTGYTLIGSPGFPLDIAGMYRLDTLLAWEDAQLAAGAQTDAIGSSGPVGTFKPMMEPMEPAGLRRPARRAPCLRPICRRDG